MTTLIIVRHGQSQSNLEKTFAGRSDVKLTPFGLQQAEKAAEYLKNFHFDAAYSSTLSRAYETALAIVKEQNIKIVQDADLDETSLGDWEGVKIEQLKSEYELWKSDFKYTPPHGENVYSVRKRFGKALDRIAKKNDNKTVLIATHGGCIRLIPSYYNNNDDSIIHDTPIPSNASVTTLIWENGKGKVTQYAYDKFLKEMITRFENEKPI